MKTFQALVVVAGILLLAQAANTTTNSSSQTNTNTCNNNRKVNGYWSITSVNSCKYNCIDKQHTFCFDPKNVEDKSKYACYTNGTEKIEACTKGLLCTSTDKEVPQGFKYAFCGIRDQAKKDACGIADLSFIKTIETTTTTTRKVTLAAGDLCSYTIKMPDDSYSGDYMNLIIKKLKTVKMSMHQYRDIGNNNILPSKLTLNDIWTKSVKYDDYRSNFYKLEISKQIDDDDKEIKYKFKPGYSKVAFISFTSAAGGTFEFDIVTNFRKNNKPKPVKDDDNQQTIYIVLVVLLVILFYIIVLFMYQWKFGKVQQQEEYQHRRSLYKQENENIRKSISRRSMRQSMSRDKSISKSFKRRASDAEAALGVEHIGTANRGPSVKQSPAVNEQLNGDSNREADYKTNGLEVNGVNGASYQPLGAQNQESVEMSMVNSGMVGESRQLLIGAQQQEDGISVPVSLENSPQEKQGRDNMQFDDLEGIEEDQDGDIEADIEIKQPDLNLENQGSVPPVFKQQTLPDQQASSEISMSMEDMSENEDDRGLAMQKSQVTKDKTVKF